MFDFNESLKRAAGEYGIDFLDETSDEVTAVLNRKDDYRSGILEEILHEIEALGDARKDAEATFIISLGLEVAGDPKWKLDWLIQSIERATLDELREKKVLHYEEKLRHVSGDDFYNEVIAVITCTPKIFLDWYGAQQLGLKGMGEVLAYHRELVHATGSAVAALYYLRMHEWYQDEAKDMEGYITKTETAIQDAIGLTKTEQIGCRKLLEKDEWLDIWTGNRHGFHINRFKPLRPVAMDRKTADAIRQSSRMRSEKFSELDELCTELSGIDDAIADNPTRVLQKHEDKQIGELPSITGKGPSTFSRLGDDIWDRKGFERYNHDENAMRADYAIFKSLAKKKAEIDFKIKELMAALKNK